MSNPNINLKDINYTSIYNEIVSYMKSQSDFSDFNFEGSALSTIVDLLSYNTFYQVLFQNILVNEMFLDTSQKIESLISHAKLQGYTVSGPKSSSIKIKILGADAGQTIPALTKFVGRKSNGEIKLFYNTEEQTIETLNEVNQAEFNIYEAKQSVNQAIFTGTAINIENQSISIPEKDLETSTLKIEVQIESTGEFETYELKSSVLENPSSTDKFFYLDRTSSGYNIVFSSFIDQVTGNTINSNILSPNSKVKVSYLVSSGTSGNGCSSISFSNIPSGFSVSTITPTSGLSSGGKNTPSLNEIKFLVPRSFASQDRVVTKDDIKVLLVNNNLSTSMDNIVVKTILDDSDNPTGEVKFKINEDNVDDVTAQELIRSRGMVGIIYTYDGDI
jgi:hypothetical protein